MRKQFALPGNSCDECGSKLALYINTKRMKILELKIKCQQCDYEEDILEKSSQKFEDNKKELQHLIKAISKMIVKLGKTLPKDKKELGKIVTNPKHPFTSALLASLLILMMEYSGFGIFMAVTWILGNLILTPVGWVLIPVVVAIVFIFRGYFNRNKISSLKEKLDSLEQSRTAGTLSEEEFEVTRDELLSEYFK